MFDQGPHVVLRRDGVCVVLKTPAVISAFPAMRPVWPSWMR